MANYLIKHYKGKYRVKCEYDKETKQFPRKLNGTFEDIDCYIDCYNNIRVFLLWKVHIRGIYPFINQRAQYCKSNQRSVWAGDYIPRIRKQFRSPLPF